MRGYIEGSLWGLIIGGLTVSAASVIDDQMGQGVAVPVVTEAVVDTTAPLYLATLTSLSEPTDAGTLPRLPGLSSAPFVDRWVPPLFNVALRPELPLLDGNSAPPPIEVEPAPEPERLAEPEPAPVAVVEEADDPLPVVDTSQAPAIAPGPAPQIISPSDDGSQPETSAIATAQTEETPGLIVINRIGTAPAGVPGQTAEIVEVPEQDLPEDAPALLRYAAAFENTDDQPILAIILIDRSNAAPDAVLDLGFAPTVIVNALADDAAVRMSTYRGAGAEVAMTIALPQGAQPVDVEVAFEAALGLLPEAAMLFSAAGDVIQGNRQVTAQVMNILAAQGLGFVAQERGLGGAIRAAEQLNVPAAPVARVLDGNNESQGAMMRALDQAAFRARQSGDAVILASMSDQTLAVLRDWAAKNTGGGTAIGPVSGILLASD